MAVITDGRSNLLRLGDDIEELVHRLHVPSAAIDADPLNLGDNDIYPSQGYLSKRRDLGLTTSEQAFIPDEIHPLRHVFVFRKIDDILAEFGVIPSLFGSNIPLNNADPEVTYKTAKLEQEILNRWGDPERLWWPISTGMRYPDGLGAHQMGDDLQYDGWQGSQSPFGYVNSQGNLVVPTPGSYNYVNSTYAKERIAKIIDYHLGLPQGTTDYREYAYNKHSVREIAVNNQTRWTKRYENFSFVKHNDRRNEAVTDGNGVVTLPSTTTTTRSYTEQRARMPVDNQTFVWANSTSGKARNTLEAFYGIDDSINSTPKRIHRMVQSIKRTSSNSNITTYVGAQVSYPPEYVSTGETAVYGGVRADNKGFYDFKNYTGVTGVTHVSQQYALGIVQATQGISPALDELSYWPYPNDGYNNYSNSPVGAEWANNFAWKDVDFNDWQSLNHSIGDYDGADFTQMAPFGSKRDHHWTHYNAMPVNTVIVWAWGDLSDANNDLTLVPEHTSHKINGTNVNASHIAQYHTINGLSVSVMHTNLRISEINRIQLQVKMGTGAPERGGFQSMRCCIVPGKYNLNTTPIFEHNKDTDFSTRSGTHTPDSLNSDLALCKPLNNLYLIGGSERDQDDTSTNTLENAWYAGSYTLDGGKSSHNLAYIKRREWARRWGTIRAMNTAGYHKTLYGQSASTETVPGISAAGMTVDQVYTKTDFAVAHTQLWCGCDSGSFNTQTRSFKWNYTDKFGEASEAAAKTYLARIGCCVLLEPDRDQYQSL
tara:strand:+ start:1653 stop:3953 length:2301 start_codon:yes stop_codon:yes gene_type:complete